MSKKKSDNESAAAKKAENVNALASLMNQAKAVHGQTEPDVQTEELLPKSDAPRRISGILRPTAAAKIDAVTVATQQASGKRLSMSDVITYALERLSGAALTADEIKDLEASDGRRRAKK